VVSIGVIVITYPLNKAVGQGKKRKVMMSTKILDRLNKDVPVGVWYSLDEVCKMIKSSSKTLVKVQLLACGEFDVRCDFVPKSDSGRNVPNTWRWMFKRVGDVS
jgi:hypothetical protein